MLNTLERPEVRRLTIEDIRIYTEEGKYYFIPQYIIDLIANKDEDKHILEITNYKRDQLRLIEDEEEKVRLEKLKTQLYGMLKDDYINIENKPFMYDNKIYDNFEYFCKGYYLLKKVYESPDVQKVFEDLKVHVMEGYKSIHSYIMEKGSKDISTKDIVLYKFFKGNQHKGCIPVVIEERNEVYYDLETFYVMNQDLMLDKNRSLESFLSRLDRGLTYMQALYGVEGMKSTTIRFFNNTDCSVKQGVLKYFKEKGVEHIRSGKNPPCAITSPQGEVYIDMIVKKVISLYATRANNNERKNLTDYITEALSWRNKF